MVGSQYCTREGACPTAVGHTSTGPLEWFTIGGAVARRRKGALRVVFLPPFVAVGPLLANTNAYESVWVDGMLDVAA